MSTVRSKSASGNLAVRNGSKSRKNGQAIRTTQPVPGRPLSHFSVIEEANLLNARLPDGGLHFRDCWDDQGNLWLIGVAPDGEDSVRVCLNSDECPTCQLAAELRRAADYFTALADAAELATNRCG
jgi:hypothetical protein